MAEASAYRGLEVGQVACREFPRVRGLTAPNSAPDDVTVTTIRESFLSLLAFPQKGEAMTVAAPVQHRRELVLSLILRRRSQIARFTARHAEKPIVAGFQRIRLLSEHACALTVRLNRPR